MLSTVLLLLANAPAAAVFDQPAIADSVLAEQRGGIRLPNGIEASWSVDTVTAVNGAVVLQTVVRVSQGAPQIATYAPATGQTVSSPLSQQAAPNGANTRISFDSMRGLRVWSSGNPTGVNVSSTTGEQTGEPIAGLVQIDPSQPYTSGNGTITQVGTGSARAIELLGPDLRVLHLTGNALGTAIANSGSDRFIDTQTTVSLNLRNAGPDVLGSAFFRVENVAIEAMSARF